MTYSIEFELVGLPRSQINNYGHWATRAREKKDWEARVAIEVIAQARPKKPLESARLEFVRYSSARPDFDNLVSSFKPLIDGLVKARVIRDDTHEVIGQPSYNWQKTAPKFGRIRVRVEG